MRNDDEYLSEAFEFEERKPRTPAEVSKIEAGLRIAATALPVFEFARPGSDKLARAIRGELSARQVRALKESLFAEYRLGGKGSLTFHLLRAIKSVEAAWLALLPDTTLAAVEFAVEEALSPLNPMANPVTDRLVEFKDDDPSVSDDERWSWIRPLWARATWSVDEGVAILLGAPMSVVSTTYDTKFALASLDDKSIASENGRREANRIIYFNSQGKPVTLREIRYAHSVHTGNFRDEHAVPATTDEWHAPDFLGSDHLKGGLEPKQFILYALKQMTAEPWLAMEVPWLNWVQRQRWFRMPKLKSLPSATPAQKLVQDAIEDLGSALHNCPSREHVSKVRAWIELKDPDISESLSSQTIVKYLELRGFPRAPSRAKRTK